MPRTRYQGSKRRLVDWIWRHVEHLEFETVLDAFGGTGAVSHMFKRRGRAVTYNDVLRFNYLVGQALIENSGQTLTDGDVDTIVTRRRGVEYPDFIERTFDGIYYTRCENRWLDGACANIRRMRDPYKRPLAYYALGQAAIVKRPYNLFHRKNLYMRTADVRRGFGNKVTWDRPFEGHFRHFAAEANRAVFDNDQPCHALNRDALDVPPGFDLVYVDPPYVSGQGVGVDYYGFYHFLEGLTDYESWPERIDWRSKHRRLQRRPSPWTDAGAIRGAFQSVFARFADSSIVVSYRSDGIPSPRELVECLLRFKPHVRLARLGGRKYALSTNARAAEILLIGTDSPQVAIEETDEMFTQGRQGAWRHWRHRA